MPIYEYRSIGKGCKYCSKGFDILQKISDAAVTTCPKCGTTVRKAVTRFGACIVETSDEASAVETKLKDYEAEGKWSHAAELADKTGLKERAMDDYKKAGYNF
jgi:putative FmdB family regulatory protein